MEKKKLKLTISGSSKKTMSNIEIAKTQGKNSVLIEKKTNRYVNKSNFSNKNQKPFFCTYVFHGNYYGFQGNLLNGFHGNLYDFHEECHLVIAMEKLVAKVW